MVTTKDKLTGVETTKFKSIIDTGIYSGNKTLRVVYSNKFDSASGLLKDRIMKPKLGDSTSLGAHLISHLLDGY